MSNFLFLYGRHGSPVRPAHGAVGTQRNMEATTILELYTHILCIVRCHICTWAEQLAPFIDMAAYSALHLSS